MKKGEWVWMPHPAHFICARDCRFHLATCVGDFVVSTVGEYLPDETLREIHCQALGITLEGKGDARLADFVAKVGYLEIGFDRKYETMVFPATRRDVPGEECCPFMAVHDFCELDFFGCNEPVLARVKHLELCDKWAPRTAPKTAEEAELLRSN